MAPGKWDDEDSESTPPSSPPPIARRGKFDDEEDDGDVLDSWDAAEDSEVEREKAKKAAETKAKADAAAKANHKSRTQRVEAHKAANLRRQQDVDESSEDEDEVEKRARLRKEQKEADLNHAQDLFGEIQVTNTRTTSKHVTVADPTDPTNSIDLTAMPLFNPNTKDQFTKLRDTIGPLIAANSKKAHYVLFLQEFAKQLAKDLPSDQVKKIGSILTTLSNEKMRDEKAAEKGGKKSKAAKTKSSLVATRDVAFKADTSAYDDGGLDDGDFM